jgi:hypothetical protein
LLERVRGCTEGSLLGSERWLDSQCLPFSSDSRQQSVEPTDSTGVSEDASALKDKEESNGGGCHQCHCREKGSYLVRYQLSDPHYVMRLPCLFFPVILKFSSTAS